MLLSVSPDLALITATAGVCLIFFELNRPGLILPGSLGLLLTLFASAALAHHRIDPLAAAGLTASALTLGTNLYRILPTWLLVIAVFALTASFRFLLTPPERPIHTATALVCGPVLGVLSAVLSRIALRARRAKAIH